MWSTVLKGRGGKEAGAHWSSTSASPGTHPLPPVGRGFWGAPHKRELPVAARAAPAGFQPLLRPSFLRGTPCTRLSGGLYEQKDMHGRHTNKQPHGHHSHVRSKGSVLLPLVLSRDHRALQRRERSKCPILGSGQEYLQDGHFQSCWAPKFYLAIDLDQFSSLCRDPATGPMVCALY